ncbi:MAG: fibronectin type III domain-containing protein, partial [Bacteroidales bacterium]|nr:fibronectin type III domain-containing protein [Bacteroidales bacterium]
MKRLLSFVMAIIFAMQLSAQQDSVAIGSGTETSQIGPVPGYYGNHRSVQLYSSSELNMPMGGVIEAISFELAAVSGTTSNRQVRIYMKEISDTTLPANMTINELANDAFLVYTSPESGEPCVANQWYRFDLQSPFVYSGVGSLYVFLEGDGCTASGGCGVNVKYTANTGKAWTKCWDTTVPTLTSPIASNNSYRANTRIFYSEISEDYCYPISGLTLTPSTESVDLTWTSDNNNFEIQYKLKSESWDSENVVTFSSSTTSATIDELLPATFYSVRVRALCAGTESVWMNANFKTSCLVIEELPWTETFESAWVDPHLPGTIAAPNCWININGDGNATYYTKPSAAYEGNGVYMYGYSSASSTTASYANKDWFITPIIELTGEEALSFYAKKSSTSYSPELRIYALDVATNGDMLSAADTVNFILIDSLADLTTTYVERDVILSGLEGEYRLAFVRNKTIAHGAVYFDNVTVKMAPSCERVTNLTATEITETSLSLQWEGSDATDSYKLYYKEENATDWTIIEDITDNYYTLTDLQSGTGYILNVTAVCDNGAETGFIMAGNLTVSTHCQVYEVPFLEDFTIYPAGELESCWLEAKGQWDSIQAGATVYGYTNLWGAYSLYVFDAHAKIESYSTNRKDWLITPNINIGDGSVEQDLVFDIAYTDWANANPVETYGQQKFAIIVSTDGGVTWDFENAVMWKANPTPETNERNIEELTNIPQRLKFNLTELGYTGVIRVGFYVESLVSGGDNDVHIDNVMITEHIDCNDMVGAPIVSASSLNAVAVSWNAEEHEAATGWNISYVEGTTNDDPENGTIVSVPYGSAMPYVVEGLTEGVTYAFSVQYDCGGAWSPSAAIPLPESLDMFATIPYTHDFEDLDENANWTITNNTYNNRWFIGHPANVALEGNMLYVSDYVADSTGANSTYDNSSSASYVFASRLIQFDESLAYEISFDYSVLGESTYDFIKVALRPWNESYVGITAAPTWTVAGAVQEGFEYAGGITKFNLDTTGARGSIIVDGAVANNSLQQLVFAWRNDGSGGTMSPVIVDNISVIPINCLSPNDFWLSEDGRELTSLSFDISPRTGDSFEIQYQAYSDTTWQSVITSDTSEVEISELLPGTMYRFRVRAICDGELTNFTEEKLYETLCPVITIDDETPYIEDFVIANWFRSGNVTSPNAYAPVCWFNVDAGSTSYRWQSSTTEPYSGEKYAQLYLTTATAVDWLITPIFDLAGTETLSFFAKHTLTAAGAQSAVKIMYYSVDENGDMSSAADTALFVNLEDKNLTNEYTPYDVLLSDLTPGQYRLAFLVSQTATTSHYIRIDNVKIANISCPRPTGEVVVSNVTPNTATVSWTDETNTAWNVYYKAEGDSTYQMVSSTEPTAELTDLTSHTYYDVYVVGSCGDEESEPTVIATFMTSCDYITELPFFEGFEDVFVTEGLSNAEAPACWLNYNGGYSSTSYIWKRTTTASYVYEGGASLYSSATSTSPGNNDWIVTPVISNEGGAVLRFFAKVSSTTSVPGITLRYLDVTTHGDVTGLADTANFVTIGTIDGLTTTFAEYEYILADLPATYRLAFVRQDVVGTSVYMDNLSIVEIPTCFRPDPASVTISEITQNTATVSWTDSDENNTTWTVYYKAESEEEFLSVTTTETTVELTDLVSGVAYEVYVVTVCSDNSESDATYTESFYTLQESVELPYTCDFEEEGDHGWLIKNGTLVNQWHVGTPTGATSSSLFISNDNGTTATYAHSASVVVAEKLFQLGTTDSVRISFDLTVGGESSFDYLKVYWLPADTTYYPASTAYYGNSGYVNNVIMNSYTGSSNYRFVNLLSGTQNMSVTLENNPNELRKLVFVWKNDGGGGNQQGAIIDNIMVEPIGEEITCTKPVEASVVASEITESSATISWQDNDESHSAWNVYYKASSEEEFSSLMASETSIELTGLTQSELYQVYVTTNCGGEESASTDTISFYTLQESVELPYSCDFEEEGTNGWLLKNGTCVNKWYVGTPSGATSGELYISSDNGATAGYANTASVVVAEKLFQLGEADSVRISFDLTLVGESTYDYLKVYWLPADTVYTPASTAYYGSNNFTPNVIMNTYTGTSNYRFVNQISGTQNMSVTLANSPNELRKLVLVWKNDGGTSNQPGAIVDNVLVEEVGEQGGTDPDPEEPQPCDAPTALSASNITETSAEITWNGTATTYEFKLNGGEAETLTTTTKSLTGLTANTAYTVEVRAICEDQQSAWVTTNFTTLEEVVTPEPCDAPTNLSASNITETSAEITWNGTATTYEFKL